MTTQEQVIGFVTLASVIATPNRNMSIRKVSDSAIVCRDGFTLSVVTGALVYCTPRIDTGPYTHVEVGFPSVRPEPWEDTDGPDGWRRYAEDPGDFPTDTVYGYVPVEMVRALLRLHGGEAS